MQHKIIAFIGAGNMSRSIISGLIATGYPKERIIASNPSKGKLVALKEEFGIQTTQDNIEAATRAEAIVLATKPHILQSVCEPLQTLTAIKEKLFVSIAAGVTSERIQQMLGHPVSIIRTMPNTPSAVGKGMTGIFASQQVSQTNREFAQALMEQVGEILWVEQESMIDGIIASAGSSPAYFFLFLEAMEKKTVEEGFSPQQARLLVQQAMLGAAEMVQQNPQTSLTELRAQVTSKGGTTACAIAHFEQQQLTQTVSDAMEAAMVRSRQMSQQY